MTDSIRQTRRRTVTASLALSALLGSLLAAPASLAVEPAVRMAGHDALVGGLPEAPGTPGGRWQSDLDPLDQAPPADVLDGPVQRPPDVRDGAEQVGVDPLDGDVTTVLDPLDDQISDQPVVVGPDPLDAATSIAVDPLDGSPAQDVIVRPAPGLDPLDGSTIAIVPAPPLVTVMPTAEAVLVAPAPHPVADVPAAKPVAPPATASLRTKDDTRRVVVVNGTLPAPASVASCGVAVVNGRLVVGVDCAAGTSVLAVQPLTPRQGTSSALIVNGSQPALDSRRNGAQVGTLPSPTLGDAIATSIRAAIFPEDVVVPDVLIVPGVLSVAGNQAREDPIILWRSELETAAATSGVPLEYLVSAIQVASNGDPLAQSEQGIGLLRVPISELQARGIPPAQWFDPAVNIAVGAELIAASSQVSGAGPSDAVTAYLAGGCDADDVCVVNSTVDDWLIYYRLRIAGPTIIADPATPIETAASLPATWPFEEPETEPDDPFADFPVPGAELESESDDLSPMERIRDAVP